MCIIPLALFGGMLALNIRGMTLNVSSAVGFIALIGVAIQNGVIMISHINNLRERGRDLRDAVVTGVRHRFRPILMTSLAFILGMLPMVIASGPGSASRQAIGTGVFFGMILAVTIGILLVPFFFVLIYKAKAKAKSTNIKKVTKRFKR